MEVFLPPPASTPPTWPASCCYLRLRAPPRRFVKLGVVPVYSVRRPRPGRCRSGLRVSVGAAHLQLFIPPPGPWWRSGSAFLEKRAGACWLRATDRRPTRWPRAPASARPLFTAVLLRAGAPSLGAPLSNVPVRSISPGMRAYHHRAFVVVVLGGRPASGAFFISFARHRELLHAYGLVFLPVVRAGARYW